MARNKRIRQEQLAGMKKRNAVVTQKANTSSRGQGRIKRSELLELLVQLSEENDALKKENERLHAQLEERSIAIEEAGSIAEAALRLNGVFKAAQDAADDYLANVRGVASNPNRVQPDEQDLPVEQETTSAIPLTIPMVEQADGEQLVTDDQGEGDEDEPRRPRHAR